MHFFCSAPSFVLRRPHHAKWNAPLWPLCRGLALQRSVMNSAVMLRLGTGDCSKVSQRRCCAARSSNQPRANGCIDFSCARLLEICLRLKLAPVDEVNRALIKPLVAWIRADRLVVGFRFLLAMFCIAGYQICRHPVIFGRTVDARASGKCQEPNRRRH